MRNMVFKAFMAAIPNTRFTNSDSNIPPPIFCHWNTGLILGDIIQKALPDKNHDGNQFREKYV